MIIHPAKQGTDEWVAARLGLPTASNFDRLITKTGKPSSAADKYLAQLVAEWFLGAPIDDYNSGAMERGNALEKQAVAKYEWDNDVTTEAVGLCTTDDGKIGASPDRLVGNRGLLEIKCPLAVTHMEYLLYGTSDAYRIQQQGQLWVCERDWNDLFSFNPSMPTVRVRVERDEELIETMAEIVGSFVQRLDAAKVKLADAKAEYDARQEDIPAELVS